MSNRLPRDLSDRASAALGHDLSTVTVHEDGEAERLGTRAFARGNQLHFARGTYDPTTRAGVELIGHELGHVAQQREGRVAQTAVVRGAAANTDPALEADADRRGAAVVQGFDLGGFLDFAPPTQEITSPITQGADLEAEPAGEHEGPTEDTEEVVDVELADVLGPDYESVRDADEEDFWETHGRLEGMLGAIGASSPGAAAGLDTDLQRGAELPGEIHSLEQALLASARRAPDGGVAIDPQARGALQDAADELFAWGEVYHYEAKFWSLLLAVPGLELAEQLLSTYVSALQQMDGSIQVALAARARFEALYQKWHPELVEARAKTAIDVLTIFADILLLTAPVSGPIGFFGGLAVSLAGLGVGQLLEPDEKTQPQSIFNGVVTALDSLRQARELKAENFPKWLVPEMVALIQSKGLATGKAIVSGDLDVALKGLGTFLDAGSLVSDGSEMLIRQQMVDEITAALVEWNAKWSAMHAVWPDVVKALTAAVPFLESLKTALAHSAPLLDAALGDVRAARALLP